MNTVEGEGSVVFACMWFCAETCPFPFGRVYAKGKERVVKGEVLFLRDELLKEKYGMNPRGMMKEEEREEREGRAQKTIPTRGGARGAGGRGGAGGKYQPGG